MDPLEQLDSKIFSEQLNTDFTVSISGGNSLRLKLLEVSDKNSSPKIELFTLTFRGPTAPLLLQQTHSLEHEQLGKIEIFITAVGVDEQGILYEAVFHRFRKPNK